MEAVYLYESINCQESSTVLPSVELRKIGHISALQFPYNMETARSFLAAPNKILARKQFFFTSHALVYTRCRPTKIAFYALVLKNQPLWTKNILLCPCA